MNCWKPHRGNQQPSLPERGRKVQRLVETRRAQAGSKRETRVCRRCGVEKSLQDFYKNKDKNRKQPYFLDCKPCHKAKCRDWELKKKYGIDRSEYNSLWDKQSGKCRICQCLLGRSTKTVPHVDHCHKTGEVRGLLCFQCNAGLGMFRDSPTVLEAAMAYICCNTRRYSPTPPATGEGPSEPHN